MNTKYAIRCYTTYIEKSNWRLVVAAAVVYDSSDLLQRLSGASSFLDSLILTHILVQAFWNVELGPLSRGSDCSDKCKMTPSRVVQFEM